MQDHNRQRSKELDKRFAIADFAMEREPSILKLDRRSGFNHKGKVEVAILEWGAIWTIGSGRNRKDQRWRIDHAIASEKKNQEKGQMKV